MLVYRLYLSLHWFFLASLCYKSNQHDNIQSFFNDYFICKKIYTPLQWKTDSKVLKVKSTEYKKNVMPKTLQCNKAQYLDVLSGSLQCCLTQEKEKASIEESSSNDKDWNKNFASPDCGAKIVFTSVSVQNVGYAISRSNDEYMLSECTKPVWFIIELCETINILRFELENHELYAGSPQNLRMSAALKFATRSWQDLGNFTSTGRKKSVEVFQPGKNDTFGKFVKVEIMTNHGEEHFCTLTAFRVFGRTEYEILAEDETKSEYDQTSIQTSLDILPKSIVQDKLNQFSVTANSEKSKNSYNIIENYKFLHLNMRKDTCTNEMTVNMMESSRRIESVIPTVSSLANEKNKNREEGNNKESILVSINSRVRNMEKNATVTSYLLRQLNQTVTVHSTDMERILEAVIKAKESFQVTLKELAHFRNELKKVPENEIKYDRFVKESSQSMKLLVMGFLLLTLFTLNIVCSMDARIGICCEPKPTKDIGTMTADINMKDLIGCRGDRRTTWCGRSTNIKPLPVNDKQSNINQLLPSRENRNVFECESAVTVSLENPASQMLSTKQTVDMSINLQTTNKLKNMHNHMDAYLPGLIEDNFQKKSDKTGMEGYLGKNNCPIKTFLNIDEIMSRKMYVNDCVGVNRRSTWCGAGSS